MWTDGSGSVTFRAYDTNDNLLGTLSSNTDDHSFYGGTAEDRFFGVTNAAGIKSISLSNKGGGLKWITCSTAAARPSVVFQSLERLV